MRGCITGIRLDREINLLYCSDVIVPASRKHSEIVYDRGVARQDLQSSAISSFGLRQSACLVVCDGRSNQLFELRPSVVLHL